MHQTRRRMVPGATRAVLFIHGIVGTPRFWDDYTEAIPQDWSLVNLLLPGHGGTVADFGRVRRGEWLQAVETELDALLAAHERVYVVGHSMGTLLAILAARKRPERIAGLLLLAVPLRIFARPRALIGNVLKGVGLGEKPEELAKYYGTAQDWRAWRYIPWIPRYLELFSLSRRARRELPELTTPASAFMCARDEMIARRSCTMMAEAPCVTLTMLPGSTHHGIAPEDRALLMDALRRLS